MTMRPLDLKKGTRLVSMPHSGMYSHLWQVMKGISRSQKAVHAFRATHGNIPFKKDSVTKEYWRLDQEKAFYCSCSRIYPALFLEAYINFLATWYDIPFRTDFERSLSIVKKYKLYMHLLTSKTFDPKFEFFLKKVVELRDYEVHPKANVDIVGNEQYKKNMMYLMGSSLHQCTLHTMIQSINKLVDYMEQTIDEHGPKTCPKLEKVLQGYMGCHRKINEPFRIED